MTDQGKAMSNDTPIARADLDELERLDARATKQPVAVRRIDRRGGVIDWQLQFEPPRAPGEVLADGSDLHNPRCKYDYELAAALWNNRTALLAAARRLLELERKALRVTTRDVTDDEIEHVTKLAVDARNALLTPGGSSAPIVRWLMWQEDRGLAVALELLKRDEEFRVPIDR